MAGHSKWANIKHKKARADAARGKANTKLIREITVAARKGGADISANPWLRLAVDKARAANMKKDTIENAIARGAGTADGGDMQEIRYEGYGPAGSAVMVDCLTDNKNRTVAEVRHAFTKAGGNLGTDGSVSYLFTKTGVLNYPADCCEDQVMEAALEAGANDVVSQEDRSIEVQTEPDNLMQIKDALELGGLTASSVEIAQIPSTTVTIDEIETAEKVMRLQERLEELDDVQDIHMNVDFTDDVLKQLDT